MATSPARPVADPDNTRQTDLPAGSEAEPGPRPIWNSIVFQFVMAVSACVTICFGAATWLGQARVTESLTRTFEALVVADALSLLDRLEASGAPLNAALSSSLLQDAGTAVDGLVESPVGLRLVSGTAATNFLHLVPGATLSFDGLRPRATGTSLPSVDPVSGGVVVSLPYVDQGQEGPASLQVLYSDAPLRLNLAALQRTSLAMWCATVFFTALGGFLVLRQILLRSLEQTVEVLRAMASDDLDAPIPTSGTSEIEDLNRALAQARDRIRHRLDVADQALLTDTEDAALRLQGAQTQALTQTALEDRVRGLEQEIAERLDGHANLGRDLQELLGAMSRGEMAVRIGIDAVPEEEADLRGLLNKVVAGMERELSDAIRFLADLSDGRLDARVEGNREGMFGALQHSANSAASKLQGAFRDLFHHSSEVLNETSDLSASAEELSKRTERTAHSLAETTGALEQITGSIAATAELAQGARGFTESAREDARQSDVVVKEAIESMREIQNASNEISRTLGVINDIAFQTNLLALNAGVEAARAGDAGRGFAVVASEVRALAQRASDAAQQIGDLISTSSDQINLGVQRVARTGDTLVTLGERIDKIGDQVSEIASAADNQSRSVVEINRAMGEIDTATQQNTAMFEEMSTANLSLKGAASQMLSLIERFDLSQSSDGAASAEGRLPMRGSLQAPAVGKPQEYGVVTADAEQMRRWDLALSDQRLA